MQEKKIKILSPLISPPKSTRPAGLTVGEINFFTSFEQRGLDFFLNFE